MTAKPERAARRAKRLALEAARAEGYVCQPTVRVVGVQRDAAIMSIFHDDWCPLLRVKSEGAGSPRADVIIVPRGSISGEPS